MGTIVDSIAVAVGLNTDELDKDLSVAQKKYAKFITDVARQSVGTKPTAIFDLNNADYRNRIKEVAELFRNGKINSALFQTIEHANDLTAELMKTQKPVLNIGSYLAKARTEAYNLLILFRGIAASTLFAAGIGWIGKFVSSFKEMKKEVAELNELSKQLGENTEDIAAWSQAVEFNGGSAKAFQKTLLSLKNDMTNIAVIGKARNKPVFELIREITKAVEGMDKAKSTDILKRLGFDSASIALIQSGSKNIDELVKKHKEWGVYTKKDTEAIDKMDKSFKQMNITLKTTFIPLFSRIIGIASKFTAYASKAAIVIRDNLDIVRNAVILLAIAFSKKLYGAILQLTEALITNPFAAFIAGLTLVILLIEDLWTYASGGESYFADFWKELGTPEEVLNGFNAIKETLGSVFKFIRDLFKGEGMNKPAEFIFMIIGAIALLVAAIGWIPVAIASATALLMRYWKDIKQFFFDAGEKIKSTFEEAFNSITSWLDSLKSDFESGAAAIGNFLSNAANVAKNAWQGFISWLEDKWNWLKDLLPGFESIAKKLPSIGNSPKMAMAGGGGVSNTIVNNNSTNTNNVTLTNERASRAFAEKMNYVNQMNTGLE